MNYVEDLRIYKSASQRACTPFEFTSAKTCFRNYLHIEDNIVSAQTILVTGANGYLALHIIQQALGKGWNVVGTLRSETAAAKIKGLCPDAGTRLSLVHISDLGNVDSFEEACRDHAITAVINAASPILNDPGNPIGYEEAVGGDCTASHAGSKALTERALWDFMKVERRFGFVSVLPAAIFGPHAAAPRSLGDLNASSKLRWDLASHGGGGSPSPWHAVHMGGAGGQRFLVGQNMCIDPAYNNAVSQVTVVAISEDSQKPDHAPSTIPSAPLLMRKH